MKEKKQNRRGLEDLDLILDTLPNEKEQEREREQIRRELEEEELLMKEERRRARDIQRGQKNEDEPVKRKGPKKEEGSERPKKKKKKKKKSNRLTNKEITRVTYMFVTLFIIMAGHLVYFNVFESKDVVNSVYNVRQDLLAERVVRGKILDRNGNVLAETVTAEDGTETREYPYGNLFAHAVGYSVKGKAGIESIQNFNLLTSNAFFVEKLMNEFQGQKNIGDNVVTTLDADLQTAASNAIGDNKGAAVVMEASTGKILAMVSKPSYDANTVAENWETLINDTDSALYNRATQGLYTPGSVFKMVTTLAYMRQNPDYAAFLHDCSGEVTENGVTIHCYNSSVHGQETLEDAVANSCNTAFSEIGLGLDIEKWKDTAEDLLFNEELKCDLTSKMSSFSLEKGADTGEIMMTAIGQGKTMVSPYHMALITSAIANGGTLMKPYMVKEIANYKGTLVKKYMPEKYTTLMTSEEASILKSYMESVISYGTGTSLNGQGYTVAGKTGTAEVSMDKNTVHSWFMGFSNVDNPDIVVSVVIENADTSSVTGTGVAKQIFNAYYN